MAVSLNEKYSPFIRHFLGVIVFGLALASLRVFRLFEHYLSRGFALSSQIFHQTFTTGDKYTPFIKKFLVVTSFRFGTCEIVDFRFV